MEIPEMTTPEALRPTPTSESEVLSLKQKMAFLARIFSRTYDMKVLPGGFWGCSLNPDSEQALKEYIHDKRKTLDNLDPEVFRPTHIFYPEERLPEWSLPAIMGALRHEVGHAKNSDYRCLFKGQKQAYKERHLPLTWAITWNGLEDPWINNLEIAGSQAVKENMRALYDETLPQVLDNINAQPPVLQLAQNISHYWFTGESLPNIKNKKILEVFEAIRPHVDEYLNGASSEKNFELLQQKIWDKVKVLEPEGAREQEMKRLIEAAANREFERGQAEGGIKDFFQELMEKMRRGKKESLDEELQRQMSKNLRKKLSKEFERQQDAANARRKRVQRQTGKDLPSSPPMVDDLDLTKVPESLREKMKEVLKALPKDLRKKLEKEARKRLDEKQAEAMKNKLLPSTDIKKNKSGQYQLVPDFVDQKEADEKDKLVKAIVKEVEKEEKRLAEIEERRLEEQKKRQAGEAKKRSFEQQMEKAGFDPENPNDIISYRKYQAIEQSVRQQVANFVRIIERYLPKKETYSYGGEFFTGPKIDWSKVSRKIPIKKYDIFKRREIREAPEARLYVWLLIDRSASMAGPKMAESLKTAVFFARVLRYFDVPLSIKFFGDHLDELLDFQQNYDDPKEKIKPRLVDLADASGQWTNLSSALFKAKEEMAQAKREFPESVGAVFVISDGRANSGIVGQQLKEYIEEMQKNLLVYGFDLSGTGGVKLYFGDEYGVEVPSFAELPKEAFKALRFTLERMAKRHKIFVS